MIRLQTCRGRDLVRVGFVALACLVACQLVAASASADTWADRLGYPAGSKVVVLHANGLGVTFEANAAGTKLLDEGLVRSAAVVVPGPWFIDLTSWCKTHADADVGLELTLNSELPNFRWKPVLSSGVVPSLVGANDFFWELPMQTMVNATAEDVERELRAQITRARESGLSPTHFTTHLGTLVTRPDFMEVYLRIARQEWIPAMIVEVTPEQIERFRSQGFPLPDDVIALLEDYPLPKVDDLRFVAPAKSFDAKKTEFLKTLGEIKPGITQIAFSPAIASDALARIVPTAEDQVWNAELMADEEVQAALTAEGVILTNWREIMARFEGRPQLSE
jgi:predicted glycoside hydrolase/deacetylase ChbG (UPF0249 family)